MNINVIDYWRYIEGMGLVVVYEIVSICEVKYDIKLVER